MSSFSGTWTINRTVGALKPTIVIQITVNNVTQAQAQTIATDGDTFAASIGTVVSSNKTYSPDSVPLT